jgi:dephospho-CoA kinase
MLKVGLTGNYFSGLDEVSHKCGLLQMPVFEADLILRFLFYNNSDTITKIRNQFGKEVFTNNQLDLNFFTDSESFRKLLKVIELDLLKAFEKWRQTQKSKITIFKSAILFEAGWNEWMNLNISVFKPNGVRIHEIQRHFKMKSTDVYNMVDSEMDVFQKNRLSDYIIHNYPAYAETVEKQLISISKSLISKTGSK